jgi:hydrogenase expression/formation protein HypC
VSEPTRDRCITCSDEAVEAEVVTIEGHTAIVRAGGAEEPVAIDLVPDAAPGDTLLCHAGIALELVGHRAPIPQVAQSHEVVRAVLADDGDSALEARMGAQYPG